MARDAEKSCDLQSARWRPYGRAQSKCQSSRNKTARGVHPEVKQAKVLRHSSNCRQESQLAFGSS